MYGYKISFDDDDDTLKLLNTYATVQYKYWALRWNYEMYLVTLQDAVDVG